MSFVSSNDAESKPEMVLALFFVAAARDINKKSIKKMGKNNRGWGKIWHFVCVEKIKKRGKIYDIQN